jgi:CRISPR-associated protein Cas1
MMHRIIDFSQSPLCLRTRLKQLVVQPENGAVQTIPFEDIAVLLVSHPQVSFSQAVLESIAENGAVLISCNRKSLPVGMFVPLAGHHQPSRRISLQIRASASQVKRAWQQIVRAKIIAQAKLLESLFGFDKGLLMLSQQVRSGDPNNIEATAARRYWTQLFGVFGFRRQPEGDDDINIRLNFGYGVLRGIVARAICASGFHPSIGLHHHNQYNAFCLADDLMEPFRPIVDKVVRSQFLETGHIKELTPKLKSELISPLLGRFGLGGELCTLFEVVTQMSASLVQFFAKERKDLSVPESFESISEDKPF